MRSISFCSIVTAPLLAAALTSTSCIYESPVDDEFYRTLWETSEAPFEELTIEFLCNGNITAQADNAAGSYGTYEAHDFTASFTGLHLTLAQGNVIIEEAHRNDDLLQIIWHYEESDTTYATEMVRLSSYKDKPL